MQVPVSRLKSENFPILDFFFHCIYNSSFFAQALLRVFYIRVRISFRLSEILTIPQRAQYKAIEKWLLSFKNENVVESDTRNHCLSSAVLKQLSKLRDFESASELYRSSDRRRSAKLVPSLADRECHVVSATSPSDRNFDFLDPDNYANTSFYHK
jgi:hypothetical protein